MTPTCAVLVRVFGNDGQPIEKATVTARLERNEIDDAHGFVMAAEVSRHTDAAGVCVLELWPNVRGRFGARYAVKIEANGRTQALGRFLIPDVVAVELDDLTPD